MLFGLPFLLTGCQSPDTSSQTADAGALQAFDDVIRTQHFVEARDGAKLHVVVVAPRNIEEPLPIVLKRTPYGISQQLDDGPIETAYRELAEDGYIFAYADVRGTGESEGEFIMNGALHDPGDPDGVDEVTDTWDTVEWLVSNVPDNSGDVGVTGVSYPGWLAGMAAVDPHPAVKAVSPQAPMTDTWMGDDFFHQGAFRMSFGVEYATAMEWPDDVPPTLDIDRYDRYDWYLQFETLEDLARSQGIYDLPSWTGFREHPEWDEYWQAKALQTLLTEPTVPSLTVGGYWDQEDLMGPWALYGSMEAKDVDDESSLVMGPWYHGGWSGRQGDSIGGVYLGAGTGKHFRAQIQRPWFAHYLHGTGDGDFADAYMYEVAGERWHAFDDWPPPTAQPRKLYLHPEGRLSFDAPAEDGSDSYVSDPEHPIPYIARPVERRRWRQWMVEDQRFVHNRPDVLSWETEVLTQDVVIAGEVIASLVASTTGSDADWVVKLIDVYPDDVPDSPTMGGYQLMVSSDIMRGRYYRSFSEPRPIPPDTPTEFTVDLHGHVYRFKAGHRIMVQVQSSWFPLYDRNPQTFVPNIFQAEASDYKAQTHTIHYGPGATSHVAVSVLP
jgi:putative CocE/NonD family hydrolase